MANGQPNVGKAGGGAAAAFEAAQKALDPGVIEALGPSVGLHVEDHTFQAIDSEGRWKPKEEFPDRAFTQTHASGPKHERFGQTYGKLLRFTSPLVTLSVKGVPESLAVVDATWWSDGLEIYAGHAGLARAQGWGSIWDNRANVVLAGTPFGNYYPANYLITVSGFINPVGPSFCEFRGGIVIGADGRLARPDSKVSAAKRRSARTRGPKKPDGKLTGTPSDIPAYLEWWSRDGKQAQNAEWKNGQGFVLEVKAMDPKSWPAEIEEWLEKVVGGGTTAPLDGSAEGQVGRAIPSVGGPARCH